MGAGAAARFVSIVLIGGAAVATTSLLVRALTTSSYGSFAFLWTIITFFLTATQVALVPNLVRRTSLAAHEDVRMLLPTMKSANALSLMVALFGSLVLGATMIIHPLRLGENPFLLVYLPLSLVLFAGGLTWTSLSAARGLGHIVLTEIPQLIAALGRVLAVVVALSLGFRSISGLSVAYGIVALCTALAALLVLNKVQGTVALPGPRSFREALNLLQESLPFAIQGVGGLVVARLDVLALGFLGGVAAVGHYQPVLGLTTQVMVLVMTLMGVQFLPGATRLFAADRMTDFARFYTTASKLSCSLTFPFLFGLAVFPESIFHALYGQGFEFELGVVWVLLVGLGINVAFGLNGPALVASGSRKSLTLVGLTTVATMLVLAVTLIPRLDALGAALATMGSYVAQNTLAAIALFRKTGAHPFHRDLVLVVAVSCAAIVVGLWLHRTLTNDGLAVLMVPLVLAAWCAALGLLRAIRGAELLMFFHFILRPIRAASSAGSGNPAPEQRR